MSEPLIFLGSGAKHFSVGGRGEVTLDVFPGGERYCRFEENIRGRDVFIIQSLAQPVNDMFMELLLMTDAARRASAQRITCVTPYLFYQRADRKVKSREGIASKLIIEMMECAGANRLLTVDAHNLCCQALTNLPFDHLFAFPIIAACLNEKLGQNLSDVVFVSPDVGGIKRTMAYADTLHADFAIVNKKRLGPNKVKADSIIGNVAGKQVIIIDDLSESASTLIAAANICRENGAKTVMATITHNCLHAKGKSNLRAALDAKVIESFITTNTVSSDFVHENFVTLDISDLLCEAIRRTHQNESISELFELKGF